MPCGSQLLKIRRSGIPEGNPDLLFYAMSVIRDTSTWYEAISYPDRFRIDFGDLNNGNTNIYRNDSVYVFRKNELVHQGPQIQEFLLLEGGIFTYPADTVISKLVQLGVDTEVFNEGNYKQNLGIATFVHGNNTRSKIITSHKK